ncbi:ABC transporter substrate-binding protein [Paraburkholderia steynii]|uniref:ABC transporter substrate-binding protein n=1 Tax=Paraburkholderia steynii TaxID=1245441 RepID=A0A4R0XD59_9BURK|nr:ABC transporter substrate-binding protein [Paraburkholderia steynii]
MKLKPAAGLGGVVLLAFFAGSVAAKDLPVTPTIRQAGVLAISGNLAYAPFGYLDASGKPAGLDVDLANAASDALGVKLDIIPIPFANMIPSLVSGRTSVAWTTFSVTPERLKQVEFVTYLSASTVFVTTAEKAPQFPSKESLCGSRIAVQTGSLANDVIERLSDECRKEGKHEIRKAIYPEQKDTIQAVLTGRVDGRFDDSTAAAYLETQTKGRLKVTPGAYFPTPIGIAVRKGDTVTAEMMRATFQRLIDNGTYGTILKKYNMSGSAIIKSQIISNDAQIQQ